MRLINVWNVPGAFKRPIDITRNSYWPYFVLNAVFSISSAFTRIRWKTDLRSCFERVALPSLSNLFSVRGIGVSIRFTTQFMSPIIDETLQFTFLAYKRQRCAVRWLSWAYLSFLRKSVIYSFVAVRSAGDTWNNGWWGLLVPYWSSIALYTSRKGGRPSGSSSRSTVLYFSTIASSPMYFFSLLYSSLLKLPV